MKPVFNIGFSWRWSEIQCVRLSMDAAVAMPRFVARLWQSIDLHRTFRVVLLRDWAGALLRLVRCRRRDRGFRSSGTVLYAHRKPNHPPPSQFCCSLRSAASVSPRNQPRLSSCTALSFKPFSIYVSPYERDRHSKMKLPPRATNFRNSLSCRIPLGNVPCRGGVGRLSERDGKLQVRCCRYSWFNLGIPMPVMLSRRKYDYARKCTRIKEKTFPSTLHSSFSNIYNAFNQIYFHFFLSLLRCTFFFLSD